MIIIIIIIITTGYRNCRMQIYLLNASELGFEINLCTLHSELVLAERLQFTAQISNDNRSHGYVQKPRSSAITTMSSVPPYQRPTVKNVVVYPWQRSQLSPPYPWQQPQLFPVSMATVTNVSMYPWQQPQVFTVSMATITTVPPYTWQQS